MTAAGAAASRVLVTGGTGFLGREVVAALRRRPGVTVRVLVRPETIPPAPWSDAAHGPPVEVVRGDLSGPAGLAAALAGCDTVVHLAAQVGGDDATQLAVTVGGTRRLLAALEGTTVRRVVLASSLAVYDWRAPAAGAALDEDTPVDVGAAGRDGYAVAKIAQERLVRAAAATAPWSLTVLRPGFVFGAGKPWVPGIGRRVGPLLLVVGRDTALPLTHVRNCAEAFALAACGAGEGATVNVVDGARVTSRGYAAAGASVLGARLRVVVPYAAAQALCRLAAAAAPLLAAGGRRLPATLQPAQFAAQHRPLRFPRDRAAAELGWVPALAWPQAAALTFGPGGAGVS